MLIVDRERYELNMRNKELYSRFRCAWFDILAGINTDNPALKGVPTGWKLKVREVLTYGGAQFIVPVAGAISLMPGTGSNPAFRRVDVDTETGKVQGVF